MSRENHWLPCAGWMVYSRTAQSAWFPFHSTFARTRKEAVRLYCESPAEEAWYWERLAAGRLKVVRVTVQPEIVP